MEVKVLRLHFPCHWKVKINLKRNYLFALGNSIKILLHYKGGRRSHCIGSRCPCAGDGIIQHQPKYQKVRFLWQKNVNPSISEMENCPNFSLNGRLDRLFDGVITPVGFWSRCYKTRSDFGSPSRNTLWIHKGICLNLLKTRQARGCQYSSN